MGTLLASLPAQIQSHIKTIAPSTGMPDTEESYEKLALGWQKKLELFNQQIEAGGMVEAEGLAQEDARGCVALTYSGSLLLIGPLEGGKRKCAYNSIGLRKDVPESVVKEGSSLAGDLSVDRPVAFENGPVKSTSAIFKVAVVEQPLSLVEEEQKISEVTVILTQGFVDVNQALLLTGPKA